LLLDNRGWWIKLGLALALFGALCVDGARRLGGAHPHFAVAVAQPAAWDGREIFVEPCPVIEVGAGFAVVKDREATLRILTAEPLMKGDWLYAMGTFHADGTLTARRVRRAPHWPIQRTTIYAVSFIVLLVFARLFWKTFSISRAGFAPRPSFTVR